MRELRVQHQGHPYRVLYIFDPRRVALLLLGGDKTADDRWYEKNVPLADQVYDNYLAEMEEETMPKTTKFSELQAQMSPEARAEARRLADEDLKEMPLHELRAARHLTQQQLAKSLDMTQAAVSQLEQRTDVYLSTLENLLKRWADGWKCTRSFPTAR
jgi:DNA-binding transcriptional regulator YiaG